MLHFSRKLIENQVEQQDMYVFVCVRISSNNESVFISTARQHNESQRLYVFENVLATRLPVCFYLFEKMYGSDTSQSTVSTRWLHIGKDFVDIIWIIHSFIISSNDKFALMFIQYIHKYIDVILYIYQTKIFGLIEYTLSLCMWKHIFSNYKTVRKFPWVYLLVCLLTVNEVFVCE